MDITREFAARPPREELSDLGALVRDWIWRTEEKTLTRDPVMDWCAEAPDFWTAVWRACRSRGANGKMHNHQSKVREANRQALAVRILTRIERRHRGFTDFDDLHDTIEELAPPGIGPVTVYDVAVRIGAFLRVEPTSLYLHAGVRIGWEALMGKPYRGVKRIPARYLPPEFEPLPADEVEDFLCTYRGILPGISPSAMSMP